VALALVPEVVVAPVEARRFALAAFGSAPLVLALADPLVALPSMAFFLAPAGAPLGPYGPPPLVPASPLPPVPPMAGFSPRLMP
jgi:hypothetical protein